MSQLSILQRAAYNYYGAYQKLKKGICSKKLAMLENLLKRAEERELELETAVLTIPEKLTLSQSESVQSFIYALLPTFEHQGRELAPS